MAVLHQENKPPPQLVKNKVLTIANNKCVDHPRGNFRSGEYECKLCKFKDKSFILH